MAILISPAELEELEHHTTGSPPSTWRARRAARPARSSRMRYGAGSSERLHEVEYEIHEQTVTITVFHFGRS